MRAVALCGLLLTGCVAYSEKTIRATDARQARDSVTGVLTGAEERTLGPPDAAAAVLFVHGFIGAGQNFADLPDRLAQRGHRARVIRLPGLGTSPVDFRRTDGGAMIAKVRSEVVELKRAHSRVFIVTHSMGAAIATIVAADEPVEGMVWGAPFFEITHRPWFILPVEWWVHSVGYLAPYVRRTERMLEVRCPEARGSILAYEWIPMNAVRMLIGFGRTAAEPERLEKIRGRLLWIHPEHDGAASRRAAERAFGRCGALEKKAVTLENSDHHIYWDCERERVCEAVIGFVDG